MNTMLKSAALGLTAVAVLPATPAMAQAKGVAVASVDAAVARSAAFTNAMKSIETTYKAQLDQSKARGATLEAEMRALAAKFQEEQGKTPQNQTALQAAAKAFQDKRTAAQAELERLNQPVQLAAAYVEEQINLKMNDAVKAAMTKRKVDLLLTPDAVLARENSVDITDAVVAELNTLVPSVQITPPAGYQPGSLIRAAQAARAGQPAPAAQPQTR